MKQAAQAEKKLRELMARGALPASQCGQEFRKFISPLSAGGAVVDRRNGPGRVVAVTNLEAIRKFHQQQFPQAEAAEGAGSRVAAVGRFRDSKALANDTPEIVSLRAWCDDAVLKEGRSVGAIEATAAHGVFSFLLPSNSAYELRGVGALVENPAVFHRLEQLHLGVSSALYGRGRISERLLDWLAVAAGSEFRLIHLPDYDPVGLNEFQRLVTRLGSKVSLHLPSDLELRFERFAKPELLMKENSRAMLAQLRQSHLPAVQQVVALIDRYNGGLEQEALFLNLGVKMS